MGHNLTLFIHFDIPFLFPPQMNKLFMKNYSLSKICTTVRKQAARLFRRAACLWGRNEYTGPQIQ